MRIPMVLAAMATTMLLSSARADEKSEKIAREAVESIFKAIKAEDIDAVMKTVSFPYFDGKELIREKDDFKKKITGFFDNVDFSGISFEINEVHEFAKIKDQIKDEDKESIKEILKDGDMVIISSFTLNGETKKMGWGIAIREGKGKIVGGKPQE